jgi:hypothetical protein
MGEKFVIYEIVPRYERVANLGDDRRLPVGLRQIKASCNSCSTMWQADESTEPLAGTFRSYTSAVNLICHCGEEETLKLRPLLARATGAHKVVLLPS